MNKRTLHSSEFCVSLNDDASSVRLSSSREGSKCSGLIMLSPVFTPQTEISHLRAVTKKQTNCAVTLQFQHNDLTCLAFPLGLVEIHT